MADETSVNTAGKRGGDAAFAKLGREHYAELGRRGSRALQEARPNHLREIAILGGAATNAKHGREHFREMALKRWAKERENKTEGTENGNA